MYMAPFSNSLFNEKQKAHRPLRSPEYRTLAFTYQQHPPNQGLVFHIINNNNNNMKKKKKKKIRRRRRRREQQQQQQKQQQTTYRIQKSTTV